MNLPLRPKIQQDKYFSGLSFSSRFSLVCLDPELPIQLCVASLHHSHLYTAPTINTSFLQKLFSHSNQSPWANLYVNGSGEWLIPLLLSSNLLVANDGSYMPHLDKHSCSGAFILQRQASRKEISVDYSPNWYRVGSFLILQAAFDIPLPPPMQISPSLSIATRKASSPMATP